MTEPTTPDVYGSPENGGFQAGSREKIEMVISESLKQSGMAHDRREYAVSHLADFITAARKEGAREALTSVLSVMIDRDVDPIDTTFEDLDTTVKETYLKIKKLLAELEQNGRKYEK